jgi:hypothetical protein
MSSLGHSAVFAKGRGFAERCRGLALPVALAEALARSGKHVDGFDGETVKL